MIAAWLVFGSLVAGLLWIAGVALERGARTLRRPARFVWLAALAASVVVAGISLLPTAPGPSTGSAMSAGAALTSGATSAPARPGVRSPSHPLRRIDSVSVPPWLQRLDRPLLALWLAGSIVWALILAGSASRLRRRRARWRPEVIDGQPVYVSHDEGPALFGIGRYSVVVPSWVLELEPFQRHLVLAHEREHARAADPVVLLTGALLVMGQPWNPFVWMMFQRLRFAVETDCDARVLAQSREVRAYGELLIDLGERTLAGAAPVAALSEPHSHLEKRVTLMTQLPLRRPRLRSLAWLSMAALLVLAACRMPRPVAQPQAPAGSEPGRALVHITNVGLEYTGAPFTIEVFANGPARVGLGVDAPTELKDTLRLDHLPAMTVDVTDSDVHIRVIGAGSIHVEGDVTGGPATRVGATGREIVLFKGGRGIGPIAEVSDTMGGAVGYPPKPSPARDSPSTRLWQEAQRVAEWNRRYQDSFEQYADGRLDLKQAADSIEKLTLDPKTGKGMSGRELREVQGRWPRSAEAMQRAYMLFQELDRRAGVR